MHKRCVNEVMEYYVVTKVKDEDIKDFADKLTAVESLYYCFEITFITNGNPENISKKELYEKLTKQQKTENTGFWGKIFENRRR